MSKAREDSAGLVLKSHQIEPGATPLVGRPGGQLELYSWFYWTLGHV